MKTGTTNVRPGELAYINRAPGAPFALGLAVRVVRQADNVDGEAAWAVQVGARLQIRDLRTGMIKPYVIVPDAWMTKIADIGEAE